MSSRARRTPLDAILRAVIYARVSKDDGGRGRSCAEQIKGCTEDCEYEKWPVGLVLMDNDRGASRHSRREREDYAKLPKVLRPGDVLVLWEPSRITRNMAEFSPFCDMLAERGVPLYYDGRIYDMRDDDDRNAVWQDILDGAKAAGKTRKRVLRAMSANVDDKKPHGREAPGYRIERDQRTGRPVRRVPDPAQAAVLQEAARRVLNFESRRSISKDLTERWHEAGGGRFDVTDIKRILTSPTTFGFRVHYGEIVGKMEGDSVLDPGLYGQLRALLGNPSQSVHHGTEPKYLLSHIARCGACLELGKPGIIQRKRRSRKSRGGDTYACWSFGHVTRTISSVDAHVEELLMQMCEDPEVLVKLRARNDSGRASIDVEMALIDQLRADIATFSKDAAKTRMPAVAVAAYVGELDSQIQEAQARIDLLAGVDPVLADLIGSDARQRWAGYAMERRRQAIRASMMVTIVRVGRNNPDIGVEVEPIGALSM